MTNLVGRDLENYVDMTGKDRTEVSPEGDYLILYSVHKYGEKDKSYLFLKNTMNSKTHVIFEGHLGHDFKYGFINAEKGIIVYAFRDARGELFGRTLLRIYDYKASKHINEIVLIEGESLNKKNGYRYSLGLILSNLLVSEDRESFCADMFDSPASGVFNHHFKCFRLDGKIISADNTIKPDALYAGLAGSEIQTGSKYFTKDGETLKVFIIRPTSDYLPANFKLKYNGLYIRNSNTSTNMRISRYGDFYTGQIVWVEYGKKLIRGSNLYDTTGEHREMKIINGDIIYAVRSSN